MNELPRWLEDQPEVLQMLHWFIDSLNGKSATQRSRPPGLRINQKHFPILLQTGGEQADQTWLCIQALANEYGVLEIPPTKSDSFDYRYKNAYLRFCLDAEATVRHWLNRPEEISYRQQWRCLVQRHEDAFPGDTERLTISPIQVTGKNAEQIVQGFCRISEHQSQNLTLRQFSAFCFWGDSKFLDSREALVRSLYPELKIMPRPILIDVYLPEKITGVLFIENQDSFCHLLRYPVPGLALVYGRGFMASAERVRQQDGAKLFSQGHQGDSDLFKQWWFGKTEQDWQVYFWGDLDYSGLGILAALQQSFPNIQAWQQGYAPLLTMLEQGQGHKAETTGKQKQVDPKLTGCHYSNQVLLPALRKYGVFIDQERLVLKQDFKSPTTR